MSRIAPGPTRPGEVATLELVVEEPLPVLVGRLVAGNGRPLARQSARAWPACGDGRARWFTTDDDGRFRVALWRRAGADESGAAVAIEFDDALGVGHHARRELPATLARTTELGDVRFAPLARIAIGRVVDERGAPLDHARIELEVEGPNGEDWTRAARIDVQRTAPGAFIARAESWSAASGSRWRIAASAPGYERCEPAPLARGALDVELRLGAGGALRGAVADVELARGALVRIAREGPATDAPTECALDRHGAFRFAASRPGTFTLSVIGRRGETLARVDALALAPGVESADPRVQALALAR